MRKAVFFAISLALGHALAQGQPAVTFEAATDRKVYREDARNEILVEARLSAKEFSPNSPASPRNVVLVLDRSGSMAGEPIAALRLAAASALASLADDDVVSVVVFGSEIEILIAAQRRNQVIDLDQRLAQLEPAGGAALYDALNQAAAQLRRHSGPLTVNQLVLITDGPPTKGPREPGDFAKLAEVFAAEGTLISTIGLGAECDEDLLADMARTGRGRFHYVDQPGKLVDALQSELSARPTLVGHDAVLTFEFRRASENAKAHGWRHATVAGTVVTYRFPRLIIDQTLSVLASAEIDPSMARVFLPEAVTVRLRWKQPDTGETQELIRVLPAHFTTDSWEIRRTVDASVRRRAADVLIAEGLQQAIEEFDQGELRAASRALRKARGEARDMNFDLDDSQIAEKIQRLDSYLTEIGARDLGRLDRKVLRSGLFNQFEMPTPVADAPP